MLEVLSPLTLPLVRIVFYLLRYLTLVLFPRTVLPLSESFFA